MKGTRFSEGFFLLDSAATGTIMYFDIRNPLIKQFVD
jgi:hypothetical protein